MVSWSGSALAAVSPLTATPAPSAVTAKAEARLARNVSASALVRGQDHVLVEHQRDGVAGGADRGADKRGPLGFQLRANHLHQQRPAVRVFGPSGPVMVEESVGEAPAVRRHILAIGGDGP